MIDRVVADFWLARGQKYRLSAWLAGPDWYLPIEAALAKHQIRLNHVSSLREVVDALRYRVRYEWDGGHGLLDYVRPPIQVLASGKADCEDAAMLTAACAEHALGSLGWKARIVSVLGMPWVSSHHFAAITDSTGAIWVVQPFPSPEQPRDLDPLQPYAFKHYEQAAKEIMATYGAKVQGFDVRDSRWAVIEKWRWLA